jgi:GT2 family glycosyltransferase
VSQTISCLESCLTPGVNIYALNNGSSSAARSTLGRFCEGKKQIRIIDSQANLGVARGRNQLIASTEEEWLLFLDNDMTVETRDWLPRLQYNILTFKDSEAFIPRLYNVQDKSYLPEAFIRVDRGKAEFEFHSRQETNVFRGGGSFVDRNLFRRLGMYDEEMFVGYEDWELCLRGALSGSPVKARTISDIELHHTHSIAANERERAYARLRYDEKLIEHSRTVILRKHGVVLPERGEKRWVREQLRFILG